MGFILQEYGDFGVKLESQFLGVGNRWLYFSLELWVGFVKLMDIIL